MKRLLGNIMAGMLCIACSCGTSQDSEPVAQVPFPEFESHLIDSIGRVMGQTALADVDNDGDLDWITGEAAHGSGTVWWFEYQSPDTWVRHTMGKSNTDVGGSVYDLNHDGWIDLFAGSTILLNPGNPREAEFDVHTVAAEYSHDSEFADINGDGVMDAIASWDQDGLYWYEIPTDPTGDWTPHLIILSKDHNIHGGVSPNAVGDIDGDGDNDVVTGEAWYENADGAGLEWKQHMNIDFGERHQYGLAVKTWVLDMDSDGDNDFVQAEADNPDSRVAWFENDGSGEWTRHTIKDRGDKQDFHSLAVADFDNDGDMDVFSGGGPLSGAAQICYVWENLAGADGSPVEGKWEEHIVANKPCHEAVAADVDADGDIDICFKPWSTGSDHIYLRNMLVETAGE